MAKYVLIYAFAYLLASVFLFVPLSFLGFLFAMALANVVAAWRYAHNEQRTMIEAELFIYSVLSVIGSYLLIVLILALILCGIYFALSANDQAEVRDMMLLFWQEVNMGEWRDIISNNQEAVFIMLGSLLATWVIHFASVYMSFNSFVKMFISRNEKVI